MPKTTNRRAAKATTAARALKFNFDSPSQYTARCAMMSIMMIWNAAWLAARRMFLMVSLAILAGVRLGLRQLQEDPEAVGQEHTEALGDEDEDNDPGRDYPGVVQVELALGDGEVDSGGHRGRRQRGEDEEGRRREPLGDLDPGRDVERAQDGRHDQAHVEVEPGPGPAGDDVDVVEEELALQHGGGHEDGRRDDRDREAPPEEP